MRTSIAVLLVFCATTCAVAQDGGGLIGFWSFDEGQGQTVRDASGHGHEGQITGGAKWVEGRKGMALEFNGTDSMVVLANGKTLNIAGDATFMAWVKTTSEEARDQLIFGDTSSGGVDRNLGIELDRGAMLICHGDGAQSSNMGPRTTFDGAWKHLAIIFEEPRYYFYVNGILSEVGDLSLPLARTPGEHWAIGGWWAGYFRGVIDEVRYYNRAVSQREVAQEAGVEAASVGSPEALSLSPRFNADALAFSAWFPQLPVQEGRVDCTLTRKGDDEPCRRFSAKLQETRPGSERCAAEAAIPMQGLAGGDYVLAATARDTAGKSLASLQRDVTIPVKPAWIGSNAGKGDVVLPPYTPVEVKGESDEMLLGVVGRTYRLGSQPMPQQIAACNEELLKGPVQLQTVIDGKPASWSAAAPTIGRRTPARVEVEQMASAGAVTLRCASVMEYDGLLRTDCVLQSKSAVPIESLVLELPFRKEHAKYLYAWPTGANGLTLSGEVRQAVEIPFRPIIWIGDDQRGLSWFCESENQFQPADPNKVIEVAPGEDCVTLRIRIIGKPVTLQPGQPLKYTFAFQATPLKPIEKDGWDLCIGTAPWYGNDYDMLKDRTILQAAGSGSGPAGLKALGVRTMVACNWTPVLAYPWPLERAADFKALVRACHAEGVKVIPYLGMQISEKAPEYAAVKDEVVVSPLMTGPDKYPGMEPQTMSFVCMHSYWKDALANYAARMMDEFDIDGLYLDTTCAPFACQNATHGCEARRLDGTRVPFFPVFDVRDAFRRLYTIVKNKKPDGIIDAHVYDCMNSAAFAYASITMNGEQLGAAEALSDALPLDRFRTEFMGVNWGVPCDLLPYRLGNSTQAFSLSLPHNTLTRLSVGHSDEELLTAKAIRKLAEDFGRREATFVPYYWEECPVQGLPKDWIVSTYRHPKNGALLIVSNVGHKAERATLAPDWKSLGLEGPGAVVDGLSRKPLAMKDGTVEVELPINGWQYLWFSKDAPQRHGEH